MPDLNGPGGVGVRYGFGRAWNNEINVSLGILEELDLELGFFSVIKQIGTRFAGSEEEEKLVDPSFLMGYLGPRALLTLEWLRLGLDGGFAAGCGGLTSTTNGITTPEGFRKKGCSLGAAGAVYLGVNAGWRPCPWFGLYSGHRVDFSFAEILPSTFYSQHIVGIEITLVQLFVALEGGAVVIRGADDLHDELPFWNVVIGLRGLGAGG